MSTWSDRIGLRHPLVQAGMGGGLATAPLAGAVSAAGGLGTVGIMPPKAFSAAIAEAQRLADGAPVAANLLLPFTRRAHIAACVQHRVSVVVLHGGFSADVVSPLRAAEIAVLQQVGTLAQARRALALGADGVVVQGTEAGGHTYGEVPLDVAFAGVRDGLPDATPVLAAGGLTVRADVERVLHAGADAAVVGTRFLATPESQAHPAYKAELLAGNETVDTMLFGVGWPMRHRVLRNAVTDRWCGRDPLGPRAVRRISRLSAPIGPLLPLNVMPHMARIQRAWLPLYSPGPAVEGIGSDRIVRASALYAGQGVGGIRSLRPAAEIVADLAGVPAS